MTFKKYSSLENHTNSKFLSKVFDYLDTHGKRDVKFVAREKIHGTNFSVIITKDSITPAKRTGPILPAEKFFGYEDLMTKYKSQFETIQRDLDPQNSVQIFGEYAGGNIQKEVDYGEKDFYVFDILTNDGETQHYMNDVEVTHTTVYYGLKIAPLIGSGTLEEMLKLPVEFESTIKKYDDIFAECGSLANTFGIKPDEFKSENVSEGLVIKPVEPLFFGESRIAIKYKTDAFKEKGKAKPPKIPTPLSDNDKQLLNEFSKFVEPARVRNVASHLGEITPKMFGQVMGLTMADLLKESAREGITIDNADAPSKLKNEIQKLVTAQVREIWQDLIN